MLSDKFVIIFICSLGAGANSDVNTLEVAHVIFRHGEKNPDIKYTYQDDPYKNETFYPFFKGNLNLIGRQTMYNLGHLIRKRYREFLGEIYSSEVIEAWSSPLLRSVLSLQLVMASLFPPSEVEKWNENLNWQPTLFYFTSWDDDKLFRFILAKEYENLYWKTCKTDEVMQQMLEKYRHWLKYIEDHTGFSKDCARSAYILYAVLVAEKEANLKLGEWTKPIFPEILEELVDIEYQHQIHTRRLKKMAIGNFMYKILNDTRSHINNKSEKKFYLYSAHEVNIAHILSVLGFMYPHMPSYGAWLAIEVHKIEDRHVLKLFYSDSKHKHLKQIKNIQGEHYITLHKYKEIIDEIFADEGSKNCTPKDNVNFSITLIMFCLCIYCFDFYHTYI